MASIARRRDADDFYYTRMLRDADAERSERGCSLALSALNCSTTSSTPIRERNRDGNLRMLSERNENAYHKETSQMIIDVAAWRLT